MDSANHRRLGLFVDRALLFGVGLLAASAAFAQQQTAAPPVALEEIVVTGSRIASPNQASTSPIQVITAKDIQLGGKTDITDLINQLPQNFNNSLGQDYGNSTSGLSTAGGVATADLRGLGPNRTLVLVDGRRLGQGSPYTFFTSPAPDLDQIPTALVDRIDVVTGGASATYGSDAIAGVVNFILKKNFEGFQIDTQLGEDVHKNHNRYAQQLVSQAGIDLGSPVAPTGTTVTGRTRNINLIAGTSFADGKGNVTAYFGYMQNDPAQGKDYDWSNCQLNENNTDANGNIIDAACGGSSNSNFFSPQQTAVSGGKPGSYSVSGTSFVRRGSVLTTPSSHFNSQPYIYMSRGDQRYTAGFIAHEDLSDYVKPYAEFYFMDDRTHQAIAPAAAFRDSNPNDLNGGNYYVNCSNPLLSAQEAAILCSAANIAADAANPGSVLSHVRLARRNVEGGARTSDYEHSNYRAVLGFKGDLGDAWNYEVYGQYYYTSFFSSNNKYLNFQAIDSALLVTGTAANPTCISGPPCVPWNIFKDGGVTPDQLSYLYLIGTGAGNSTLRTFHTDITGKLGKYGIKSPFANEGLAVNIGVENRNDREKFTPDSGEGSGQLSGFGSAAVAIDNGITVNEQFVELRAPLVQDKPGIKDLLFDTGFRRSDYSLAGKINTNKFEVQYAPISDVRFRAAYQKAIRAPSVLELYVPQLVGLVQLGDDPCAPGTNTGVAAATLAQCLQSVSPAQAAAFTAAYGNGGTTNTIPQATSGQLSQKTGGNLTLKPEEGDSYTFGVTLAPTALPNLTASIDYYRIQLKDTVGPIPASLILNCPFNGNPAYCSQVVRSPSTFGLVGNAVATGGYITQTNVNIGKGKVSGIDLQLNYKLNLPMALGTLAFAMNGAYLQNSIATPLPGQPSYDCVGLFGLTCQTINPRWHHIFRTAWATPWDVTAALTWRYVGSVKLDNNTLQPGLSGTAFGTNPDGSPVLDLFNARIPSYSYLDLAATWNIPNTHMELRGGVNNILDKDPPLITLTLQPGGANTYGSYDAVGRQLFIAFTGKF